MRSHAAVALAVALMTAGHAAPRTPPGVVAARAGQSETAAAGGRTDAGQDAVKKGAKQSKAVAIAGCVSADDDSPERLTITDAKSGSVYRLSGTDLHRYVGQRVEVIGGVRQPPVHVRFGLLPSPNVAAQAGAIDPAQAAIAAAPGGTGAPMGDVTLPEFHVTRIRAARGACRQ